MPSKSVTVTGNHTLRFVWEETSTSTSGNYSTVHWELYVDTDAYGAISLGGSQAWSITIDGTTKSGTDSGGFSANAHKLLGSGDINVYHDNDGSKTFSYSFKKTFGFTWGGTYRGEYSGSGTGTLTVIPRASGLSVSNGTLGTAQVITADRKASSFVHTLTWSGGGQSGTLATLSSATSWNFTPGLDLAVAVPSGTTLQVTFVLETYSGTTFVGSASKTVTMSVPVFLVPVIDEPTIDDLSGYFAELGKYLQTQSRLKITTNASGIQGSSITAFKIEVDGRTYNHTLSPYLQTAMDVTETPALQGTGSLLLRITVYDTRSRSATLTKYLEVQSYDAPRITQLDVHRCNQDGTENQSGGYAKVTYSFSVSSVGTNAAKVRYKKSQDVSWTELTVPGSTSVTGAYVIFEADDGSPYDIELVVTSTASDEPATRTTSLSTGYTIMHFPASGYGVTFGGVATRNGFNVNMLARFEHGLLYKPKVLNAGDCDTLLESGTYFIGHRGTNWPSVKQVGWLNVLSINDGLYCVQYYVTVTGQLWCRYRTNDTWKSWTIMLEYFEMYGDDEGQVVEEE